MEIARCGHFAQVATTFMQVHVGVRWLVAVLIVVKLLRKHLGSCVKQTVAADPRLCLRDDLWMTFSSLSMQ